MPVDDAAKLAPPSVLFQTATELEPVKIVLELPGAKLTELTDNEPVPPTWKSHETPSSIERNRPWPALATRIVLGSFGSRPMSLIASTGHVPSCTGVHVTPSLTLLYSCLLY